MKALLFPIAFCLAVSTLAAVPEAQGGVRDGSAWTGGGVTISMDVGFTEGTNVTVQAISAYGWSNTTTGTPGANHSNEHASCDDSGVMNVPTETGSMQVRCKDGKVERNKNGQWIPMRRNFRMDNYGPFRGHTDGPGEEVVTLPFSAGSAISFEEYRQIMGFQADPTTSRTSRRN